MIRLLIHVDRLPKSPWRIAGAPGLDQPQTKTMPTLRDAIRTGRYLSDVALKGEMRV